MASEPAYSSPLRVALVGAGSVGTAVAALLKDRGHDVMAVWSRSPESAARAEDILKAPVFPSASAAVEGADVVLLGVVDTAISAVAGDLAPTLRHCAIVVHFAGAVGLAPLVPLVEAGARVAALHPVQSIPDPAIGVRRLPGSAWGITCAPELRAWAHDLIENELDGLGVDVAEADRPLWHAAAVMTSNGIAALMSTGVTLLRGLGVADAQSVLDPLAAGTVANVRALGRAGDAFTGPVVRGDRATVEGHLAALRARFPELLDEYTLIARAIVAGAGRTARIDTDAARSMRDLLETA
jgi:predicted short-subunit dehydrogenase-like oxidoreductase (DUF2520 family)